MPIIPSQKVKIKKVLAKHGVLLEGLPFWDHANNPFSKGQDKKVLAKQGVLLAGLPLWDRVNNPY